MLIGYAAIHISRAGEGVHLPSVPPRRKPSMFSSPHTAAPTHHRRLPGEHRQNPSPEGQVLQIVVFSVLFAMALAPRSGAQAAAPFSPSPRASRKTMFKFTNLVMYAAPLGVFGAVAYNRRPPRVGSPSSAPETARNHVRGARLLHRFRFCCPSRCGRASPSSGSSTPSPRPVTIGFATASSEATLPSPPSSNSSPSGVPRENRRLRPPHRLQLQYGRRESLSIFGLIFLWSRPAGLHLNRRSASFDDPGRF